MSFWFVQKTKVMANNSKDYNTSHTQFMEWKIPAENLLHTIVVHHTTIVVA